MDVVLKVIKDCKVCLVLTVTIQVLHAGTVVKVMLTQGSTDRKKKWGSYEERVQTNGNDRDRKVEKNVWEVEDEMEWARQDVFLVNACVVLWLASNDDRIYLANSNNKKIAAPVFKKNMQTKLKVKIKWQKSS